LALLLFLAVAAKAGRFKHWPDIFGVGQASFVGGRGKFGEIDLRQIKFLGISRWAKGPNGKDKDTKGFHVLIGHRH
jgi:hypothetical protein